MPGTTGTFSRVARARARLVAEERERFRAGPHEHEVGFRTGESEGRALREESVARMERVAVRVPGRANDRRHIEVGSGPAAFESVIASFRNPLYVAFHVLSLVGVIFVGVRFFRLFPKAQPPRIGPAKPPPEPVIVTMLYGIWGGVTLLFALVLAGVLF